MSRTGYELAISVTKRPQTYTLDRLATGIGSYSKILCIKLILYKYIFQKGL
jgi:hypothetical protein